MSKDLHRDSEMFPERMMVMDNQHSLSNYYYFLAYSTVLSSKLKKSQTLPAINSQSN